MQPIAVPEPVAQRALEALNQAALAIASELDVDKVLQLLSLIHISEPTRPY